MLCKKVNRNKNKKWKKTLVSLSNPAIKKNYNFQVRLFTTFKSTKSPRLLPLCLVCITPYLLVVLASKSPGQDRTGQITRWRFRLRSVRATFLRVRGWRAVIKKKRESNTRDEPRLEGLDGLRASSEFLACLVSCDKILRARVRLWMRMSN